MAGILVATNQESRQDPAVACGLALGKKLERRVGILRVYDEPPSERERERFAVSVSAWAEAGAYPASHHVAAGEEDAAIIRQARELSADIIVLGPHRSTLLNDLFCKSMVEDVIEDTDRMVLVAGGEQHRFANILAVIDCSQPSAHAARAAHDLFPDAPLNFVRAWHVPYEGFLSGEQTHQDFHSLVRTETREFFDRLASLGRPDSWKGGKVLIREGEAVSVVKDCLAELDADLLVIGVEGRSHLLGGAIDATSSFLLESPPCDVLAVQSGQRSE